MVLNIERRTRVVETQVIQYIPEQFDELRDFLSENYGVVIDTYPDMFGEADDPLLVKMPSWSGSTHYYIHPGDYIVIDENGEVRPAEEKDQI